VLRAGAAIPRHVLNNAALNQLTNIEAFNVALGSQRISTSLLVTASHPPGTHSPLSKQGSDFDSNVTVEVYPGDLWRKENVRPVPAALTKSERRRF